MIFNNTIEPVIKAVKGNEQRRQMSNVNSSKVQTPIDSGSATPNKGIKI